MQITDILNEMGGVRSIARELGLTEEQARSGAEALAPAVIGGFEEKTTAPMSGGSGLVDLISRLGGGSLLDRVHESQATDVTPGNNILGSIFGSKDVSRDVAQRASTRSGLDTSTLKKMLPLLAMMVAGYVAKKRAQRSPQTVPASSGGGLGGVLADLFN